VTSDGGVDVPDVADAEQANAGLGRTTARGAAVTLAGQLTQVVLQFASVVVLARLLDPRQYGLYATVLVLVGVGEIFRDFGLSSAAVQAKLLTRLQRDNLFWINTALGVVLCLLTVAAAPLVAAVFDQHALLAITQVLGLTFVVNGAATQFRAGLNRDLRFGRLALSDLIGQVVGLTVAVVAAALGAGYWALVASQLAQVTTIALLLIAFARWLPRLPRRAVPMRAFLRFGWHLVVVQVIDYVGNTMDSALIALRFGPAAVGEYNRAFQLVTNPLNQFRTPATTVALPVLARLRDDVDRANDYLRRGQLAMGYTAIPALALAIGCAAPLVQIVLGSTWTGVTPIFAWLAAASILQLLAFVGYWAYLARGLTAQLLRYTLVAFALRAVGVGVGSIWGVTGVAGGYALVHLVEWPLSLWWISRYTPMPLRALYAGAGRLLALAVAAVAVSFVVSRELRGPAGDVLAVLAAALAVVAVYAAAAVVSTRVRRDLAEVVEAGRKVLHRRSEHDSASAGTPLPAPDGRHRAPS
jgi:PST family polysaccharide transporter